MAKIFLSYGRGDDEAFVKRLYERLNSEGFSVWYDRVCMPSRSLTFLQEIRDEIQRGDHLILIIGPAAIQSDYVRAEWHHALASAKVVIPILRVGTFEILPPELNNFHCPDARVERNESDFYIEIARILKEPIPPLAIVLGGVPDLPPRFQPRPEELSLLANIVFFDLENPISLPDSEKIILIHGMGGVGKTVIASAFARSTSTRRVFKDGIYWLAVTPNLDTLALCNRLGQLITGMPQYWSDLAEATLILQGELAKKRSLIILDNVWGVDQLEPLLNCLDLNTRLLITTRDAGLIAAIGGRAINILELSKGAALRQLADWVGEPVENLPDIAQELVKECGYLPFALALNGAMLAEGVKWEILLDELKNAQIDYAEKRFANYPYPTVLNSIKVSTDALAKSEAAANTRFFELSVFNWEKGVSETAIAGFWKQNAGLSSATTRKLLGIFENKSLLKLTDKASVCKVNLHDLMLDFLRISTDAPAELNQKLIDSYRKISVPDWPNGPKDDYFHQNIVAHLLKADQLEEAHRLFSIETKDGLNGWYVANESIDNLSGYLEDIDAILRKEAVDWNDLLSINSRVKYQLQYGLVKASLRSLAGTLPAAFRAALLRTGIWGEARTVAEALQIANQPERFHALLKLIPFLKEPFYSKVRQDLLLIARAYKGNDDNLLAKLVPLFQGDEQKTIINNALFFAFSIGSIGYRAKAIAQLVAALPESDRPTLMPIALNLIQDEITTAEKNYAGYDSIVILAPFASKDDIDFLVGLIRKIPDEFMRAMYFARILPFVTPDAQEIIAQEGLIEQSKTKGNSVWIYIALKQYLPEFSWDALYDEIIQKDKRQVDYLISLLPKPITDTESEKWLNRIPEITFDSELDRIEAYLALIPHLGTDRKIEVINKLCEEIPQLPYDSWRESAFSNISQWLNAAQMLNAKGVLLAIADQNDLGYALLNIFDYLDLKGQTEVKNFFLSEIDVTKYLELYIKLAQKLPNETKMELLIPAFEALQNNASITGGITFGNAREQILSDLIEMAPDVWKPEILNSALDWIFRVPASPDNSAEKLVLLIKHLSPDLIERAAVILLNKAIHDAEHVTNQSISGTTTGDDRVILNTIRILSPYLNVHLIQECIRLADSQIDQVIKWSILIYLSPYLDDMQKTTILKEAFEHQKEFDLQIKTSSKSHCKTLVFLSDLLPNAEKKIVLNNALTAAKSIDESWRCHYLLSVAEHLDGNDRMVVLYEALQLAEPWDILKLCQLMPPGVLPPAYEELILKDVKYWGSSLTLNLPFYLEHTDKVDHYNLWEKIQPILFTLNRKDMAQRLSYCTSLLYSIGSQELIQELKQSLLKVNQWWK